MFRRRKSCQINFTATFAIYADPKSGIDTSAAASNIQKSIEGAWHGDFKKDGVRYSVFTSVTVSVVDSKAAGVASGAQNVIQLLNGPVNSNGRDSFTHNTSVRGQDAGEWNANNLSRDSAHEFTHALGVGDRVGSMNRQLSNTDPNNRFDTSRAQKDDLRWGTQEVTGRGTPAEATVGVPGSPQDFK